MFSSTNQQIHERNDLRLLLTERLVEFMVISVHFYYLVQISRVWEQLAENWSWILKSESESDYLYSILLWNSHLPIRYDHRQSRSTIYWPQARPAPTGPGLRLTAMPLPNLPFNVLHLRNPCKLHGSLLTYQPRRDGRLSWPSWLTHSWRLTHEMVTRQPWIRRKIRESPPAADWHPNHWAKPPRAGYLANWNRISVTSLGYISSALERISILYYGYYFSH